MLPKEPDPTASPFCDGLLRLQCPRASVSGSNAANCPPSACCRQCVAFEPLRRSCVWSWRESRCGLLGRFSSARRLGSQRLPEDGEYRKIVLRYLFVVNPPTGQLATIVWRIDLDEHGRYLPVTGPAVLVRPNLVATSPLHVDGGKVYWGIPSNEAFAIVRLPPGTPIDVPPELSRLLGQQVLTPQIAWDMEWRFRRAIGFSGTE